MAESQRQLSKFTVIFASGTFASRILGLIRDITWFALIPAASLGPFLVAFKLPNMLRMLIGEGASNAAFVPVFSESLEKDSEEEYRELVSAAMSAMLIVLALLTILGVLILPALFGRLDALTILTRKDAVDPERVRFMATLAQWTFPYLFFIGMAVFAMGPLFTVKHYFTPSWSPALLNIAIIGSCLALRNVFENPAYALVTGVWLGGVAQMGAQYIALGKKVGVWKPNFRLSHPGLRVIFWLLAPVLLGQATGEVNKLVDTLFAAVLGDDKVTALYAANRLVQLPLSVFGLAVTAAILPSLSRSGAREEFDQLRVTLVYGLRQTFFLVFPALAGLILMREPIVRLLFERGEFSAQDTGQTATALLLYALGLLSFVWVKVLASGFYAVKNTKTPVIVATVSMVVNILLNCVLVGPLGYKGLALATTISFTINFVLLYVLLYDRFGPLWDATMLKSVGYILVATALMLVAAYGIYKRALLHFGEETLHARALCVILPVTCAVLVYAGVCHALGVPDLRHFTDLLLRRTKADS